MIEPSALKRGYYLLNTDGGSASTRGRRSGDPLPVAAIGVLLRTRRLVTVAEISKEIGRVTFEHVGRSHNAHADRLANQAMDDAARAPES